jgi:hypothetical protein
MHGSVRRPVQDESAPALEYAIEDRGGEIVIVEHGAPDVEGFVRREDHGSVLQVAVVHDVVEHVGGVV